MADVYTVTFILLGILITLPGLLVGLNLLFPALCGRIEQRIATRPGRNLFVGVPATAVLLLWAAIASNSGSGVLRGSAFLMAGVWMGVGTLGAAGMARLLGSRLAKVADPSSKLINLVRGAVVFEFACLFPLVGWFLFAPIAGVMLVGAAVSSLRRGRAIQIVIDESDELSIVDGQSSIVNGV